MGPRPQDDGPPALIPLALMNDNVFGDKGFRFLWKLATDAGYTFVVPGDLAAERPLFLRHDVDLSIAAATELANLEGQLGIRATYLVMLRSQFYSLTDRTAAEFFDTLAAHGHHLGIHFDPAIYGGRNQTLESAISKEIDVVEWLAQRSISAFSVHQPTLNGMVTPSEDSILHLHGEVMSGKFTYISDSCMSWREPPGPVLARADAVQLLLHPEYWVSAESALADVMGRLSSMDARRRRERFEAELRLMEETVRRRAELDGRALQAR